MWRSWTSKQPANLKDSYPNGDVFLTYLSSSSQTYMKVKTLNVLWIFKLVKEEAVKEEGESEIEEKEEEEKENSVEK